MDIYRIGWYQGLGGRLMQHVGPNNGSPQPACPINASTGLRECQWAPTVKLPIPKDWLGGVYLGKLTAERDGLQSYVIFIIRDDRACDFLFQCSDSTWAAYNRWPSQWAL